MIEGRRKLQARTTFENEIRVALAPLYDFARTLAAPAEAEDLVQTACLRAFEHRDDFTSGTRFKAWIFTILKNEFLSRHRRERRRRELASDLPTPITRDGAADDLEALLLDAQWHAEVRDALTALPETYRGPVYLKDVGGFSYEEIAAIEGCPLGTVMSRLSRGRALLRGSLAKLARERGLLGDEVARGVRKAAR